MIRWIGAVADFADRYGSDPIAFGSGIVHPGFCPPTGINTSFYSYLFGATTVGRGEQDQTLCGSARGGRIPEPRSQFCECRTDRYSDHKRFGARLHLVTAFGGALITASSGRSSLDFCSLCHWELNADGDPEHAAGYTNGRKWLCTECHDKFLEPGEK